MVTLVIHTHVCHKNLVLGSNFLQLFWVGYLTHHWNPSRHIAKIKDNYWITQSIYQPILDSLTHFHTQLFPSSLLSFIHSVSLSITQSVTVSISQTVNYYLRQTLSPKGLCALGWPLFFLLQQKSWEDLSPSNLQLVNFNNHLLITTCQSHGYTTLAVLGPWNSTWM